MRQLLLLSSSENELLYQLDNQGRRYWLHGDERGSTIAATDASGTATPHTCDEHGDPLRTLA